MEVSLSVLCAALLVVCVALQIVAWVALHPECKTPSQSPVTVLLSPRYIPEKVDV